jgi:DNA-binding winged helix-turn-helix (wHTH) protein
VSEDGVLRVGDRTVVLSVSEARLVRVLLESAGRVVRRDTLARTLWSGAPPSPKALDALVYRTRRRLAAVGLLIHTSHGRGFVIETGHGDESSP